MCGIVGALSLERTSVNPRYLKSMTDKISHRGPDDAGYLYFHTGERHQQNISFHQNLTDLEFKRHSPLLPPIEDSFVQGEINSHDWDLCLGHRRLSIIDTTPAGHQPMSDLSKEIWVVYNGEIYNFKELREELKKEGYSFKTNGDTEVIIYAYIHWGIEAIKKFNGMFAIALYDNRSKKLFLVRDRYGIKPLYYSITKNKNLIFASENKAILEYKDEKFSLDKKCIYEYFTFQNIFTDRTFFNEIKLLNAGHYIEIDLKKNHKNINPIQYWDFNFSNKESVKDEREYVEELDRLFNQAVEKQLIADVEVGSYLSGGIDSGAITAIASKNFQQQNNNYLKTFTVGFDLNSASGIELGFDEREKSEYMSYLFKTEHYEMVLKSGDMQRCLPEFAYHLEEPRVGQSYPNYYAAKLASKFTKVVLSGTGGDELFAGYPWRYYRAVKNNSFKDYIDKYYLFWQRLLPNRDLKELFLPIKEEVKDVWTRDIFQSVFQGHSEELTSPEDYINHSLYFEAKTFLHGLLVVEDKLSMAHSIETRVPFLDNDLVDFAQKIPVNMKLGKLDSIIRINENELGDKASKYYQKTNDGKLILRMVMDKYIPKEITGAVKQGFSSPDDSWFKGESVEFVKNILNKDSFLDKMMNKKKVFEIVNAHLTGEENRRLFIWSLLNFYQWGDNLEG